MIGFSKGTQDRQKEYILRNLGHPVAINQPIQTRTY